MSATDRPLSPHLQVYRPQLTSMLSILHRITGFGLAVGGAVAVWWLLAVAGGPESYRVFYGFCKSIVGQFMLFCWLFALVYHFLNGIRHLVWDTGHGFELKTVYRSGWAVISGAVIVTLLFWFGG